MGIVDRFSRAVKSNINALIDKAEDPAKVLSQTIEDMSEELKKARQEVVSSLASVKHLEKKQRDQLEESSQWERRAMLALEQGDEELAKEALKRKKKNESEALDTDKHKEQQSAYVTELRATIELLERKLEELKARKTTLSSQVSQARASTGNPVGGSNAGAVGRLREMQDRIDAMEAEVEAHDVLEDPKKNTLEERFRKLERGETGDGLEDELAALKARLKK